jgi:hypothetical protein
LQTRDEAKVTAAFREAGRQLQLDVIAPFLLPHAERHTLCLAYLPYFSGRHGIVVLPTRPPSFETDASMKAQLELLGYSWSFVNVTVYAKFDRELFIDTLREWGFAGPPDKRPSWL